ncbi:MAG: ABC transporter permease [Proteobacteria bacterium]|nr:ABC transporter permease [Pseudomonadota bacterium]
MSLFQLFKAELGAVFTNIALLLTLFGGVLFYSVLYPLPYVTQVPREQQVVVVNLDDSQFARRLVRMVDATAQVQIHSQASSLAQAEERMIEKKLAGILVVPENFYRDLLLGRRPSLAFAGDASYFLVFGTVLEGMSAAGTTLAAEIKVTQSLLSGQALALAQAQHHAINLGLHALFNETQGYVNYVIPAVFVLILHQTLIMGMGILGGSENEQQKEGKTVHWQTASPAALLLARTLIFIIIYTLLSLYYYGPAYAYYDIPRLAAMGDLALLNLVFLLPVSFLGICLGAVLPRRELATLIVLLSSMPLVFACGFVWPISAIPGPINTLMQLIPAVPAIKAFILLNQMGADFRQIFPQVLHLTILTAGYGLSAFLLLTRRMNRFAL